jgi:hypothetical protein
MGVELDGFRVVLEGDIVLTKSFLTSGGSQPPESRGVVGPSGRPRFQWTHGSPQYYLIPPILLNLSGLPNGSAHHTAFQQAMAAWNSVYGSKMRLVDAASGQSSYYPAVSVSTSSSFSCTKGGDADYPHGSSTVGGQIRINSNPSCPFSLQDLTKIATHEIGHVLGFRHSNWQWTSETQCIPSNSWYNGWPCAQHLAGTPSSDESSIFHSTPSTYAFSPWDEHTIRFIWSGELGSMTGGLAGSNPRLSWTPVAGATAYKVWYVNKVWDGNGGFVGQWTLLATTTSTEYVDYSRTGSFAYQSCASYDPVYAITSLIASPNPSVTAEVSMAGNPCYY